MWALEEWESWGVGVEVCGSQRWRVKAHVTGEAQGGDWKMDKEDTGRVTCGLGSNWYP